MRGMGSNSFSHLAIPAISTPRVSMNVYVPEELAKKGSEAVAQLIRKAYDQATKEKADKAYARKLKRRLADIQSGKRKTSTLEEVKAKHGL